MAAQDAAKKTVADDKAQREKETKEAATATKGHPTPSQEELDHAKMGVLPAAHHLKDDGSTEQRLVMGRTVEARPGSAGAYQTRAARPATSTP